MSQNPEAQNDGCLFIAQVTVPASHHAVFEELYDKVHAPSLLSVPGVRSCRRFQLEWSIGEMAEQLILIEVDHPDVPKSDAWAKAANLGGWGAKVRPFYTHKQYGVFRPVTVRPLAS
jgi:hypothetical protein